MSTNVGRIDPASARGAGGTLKPALQPEATGRRGDNTLKPTSTSLVSFTPLMHSPNGYFLSDVRLDIPNPTTATFSATLNGPPDAPVWARAWLSTEAGTLAASGQLTAGDRVTLEVVRKTDQTPQNAVMRIESAPSADRTGDHAQD